MQSYHEYLCTHRHLDSNSKEHAKGLGFSDMQEVYRQQESQLFRSVHLEDVMDHYVPIQHPVNKICLEFSVVYHLYH